MTWNLFPLVIIAVVLFVVLNLAAGLIWVWRHLLALWQDRYGPNRVGPFGLGQVLMTR
jgi:NADH-quinone oxidoreductase subunit H